MVAPPPHGRPRLRAWRTRWLLARRSYNVVGVDGSRRMVEVARHEPLATRSTHRSTCMTSARRSASRTRRWEVSSRSSSIHAFPHPAAFIAEIRRCLGRRARADHRSPPRQRVAQRPEPVLAAARSVLPARARRRPLLRHELPPRLVEDQGRIVVERRTRCRERAGSRVTSRRHAHRKCPPTPGRGAVQKDGGHQ